MALEVIQGGETRRSETASAAAKVVVGVRVDPACFALCGDKLAALNRTHFPEPYGTIWHAIEGLAANGAPVSAASIAQVAG